LLRTLRRTSEPTGAIEPMVERKFTFRSEPLTDFSNSKE
jgi:hypothetical protein